MQVQAIYSIYAREPVTATPASTKVEDVIGLGFVDSAIALALKNTAALGSPPYPMLSEWKPVEAQLEKLDAALQFRSSRNEIDLLQAEAFTRNYIASAVEIFKRTAGRGSSCGFEEAEEAAAVLCKVCQSYANRVRDMSRNNNASIRVGSPALDLVYESALLLLHLLRAGTYIDTHNSYIHVHIPT